MTIRQAAAGLGAGAAVAVMVLTGATLWLVSPRKRETISTVTIAAPMRIAVIFAQLMPDLCWMMPSRTGPSRRTWRCWR